MNSDLLSYIEIDPAYILIGMIVLWLILFILILVTMGRQSVLKKRYEKFMTGKDGESLEELVTNRFAEVDKLKLINKKHRMEIDEINEILNITFQKFGIVRYDAFPEMGGSLSFALVLLDKKNDGMILNAIHSREGCYTYIKDIKNGTCDIELSDEEKNALNDALK